MPAEATRDPPSANTTLVVKPPLARGCRGRRTRRRQPWLRAAMLTPSVSGFMTATRMGAVDPRWQRRTAAQAGASLVMTFSADPHLGMVADRFSGSAVVFLATATFMTQTASLQ